MERHFLVTFVKRSRIDDLLFFFGDPILVSEKTLDRSKITICNNSNIIESWASLMGQGYEVNLKELRNHTGTVTTMAEKRKGSLTGLAVDNSFTIHPSAGLVDRPFWLRQFHWNGRRQFARVGKKFISVHKVSTPSEPYTRFENEILAPLVDIWIPIYQESIAKREDSQIARIGVGYSNRFVFDPSKFLMRDFFNFGVRVNLESPMKSNQLGALGCTFQIFGKHQIVTTMTIDVSPPPDKSKPLVIQIMTQSEMPLKKLTDLGDKEEIVKAIREVQSAAKLYFYSICTDKTLREVLGARTE